MHPFFHGLLFGLIFWIFVGPALFALIQTSIQRGFKEAIFLAIGISLSDIMLVVLTLMGVSSFLGDEQFRFWMGIFGAGALISYSIYNWFKPPPEYKDLETKEGGFLIKYTLRGLILNGLNPFLLFFWLSWISFVSVNYGYEGISQRYFFTGLLVTVLSSDIILLSTS